jgi:hypothetical protein
MELALNLAWVLLTLAMAWFWLRFAPRDASSRRVQMVALAVLVIILLPAISMTDDLLAAQNPAEVDSCLRRDHEYFNPHSIHPAVATLPPLIFAGLSFGILRVSAPGVPPSPAIDSPALAAIQNRPPPAA